ncbi:cyclodeaminase/cyclohydrolase family protein [bacterium]|nr:cyclodeaminase/cyclohydrolase family protein [bacterium]
MLVDHDINCFLDELASQSPAPGGGSVAAMSGALGTALISMVCRLTIGKKGYENVEENIADILSEAEQVREEFIKLIDLDAEAFSGIMKAYKFPKETDEEKKIRTEAIQAATLKATQIPMRIIELSVKMLSLAHEAGESGNKNVVSDIGVAGAMLNAAVDAAWYNVEINLSSIKDKQFFEEISERGEILLDEAEELYESVMEIADLRIG